MYIQISHVSKSFGGQEVLKDISFTINEGEKVALLGKNGSGKSTLLKILTHEEEPDEGKVIFYPGNLLVGYLPQATDDNIQLSSGEKLKKRFREVLDVAPDVLVLDEPTNHLDFLGMEWLEKAINRFSGPVLIVSHDRYFLDRTVNRIIELENGESKSYGGNYSLYKQQKQIEVEANLREYYEQQKRLRKLESRAAVIKNRTQQLEMSTTGSDHYVRRKAAKSAKSAIAMDKRIQKELSETKIDKPEPNWELKALFTPGQESSQTVVQIKSVDYKNIFKEASLTIHKGQRIALTGLNGSGKTTLVKLILGQLKMDRGEITIGNGVTIGYLSQEHRELDFDRIVLDKLTSPKCDRTESYKLLRRFLLPPEKINQPVKLLSSGEKAKLLLAKIMTGGANFIILDEPTNHLDIPSREATEEALANYPGTLLVISHDRYFLERIEITNYFEVSDGKVSKFDF